jgi:polyisoprenoid-binding protein YceI
MSFSNIIYLCKRENYLNLGGGRYPMKGEFEPGHTSAEFKVRHMMVTWVRGSFKKVKGSADFDPDSLELKSISAKIPASGIWTGDEGRDGHLKSESFLDVENHKEITFESSDVKRVGGGEYIAYGELTIRGVMKPVELRIILEGVWDTPFWIGGEDKGPVKRAGFSATTKINRKDFGISWKGDMDKGGVVVGNDVYITLDAEVMLGSSKG